MFRTRVETTTGAVVQEVDGIDTSDGFIDLTGPIAGNSNRRPVVVLAMGAIESARLLLYRACWLLDTDYNDLCFHVSQAFFPRTGAWENLKRALRGRSQSSRLPV